MYLERLSLAKFRNNEIEDLNYFKIYYDSLDAIKDKRINKIKKKKEVLVSTFEILSSIFDLKYDLKLKFDSLNDNEDTIYLDNIDKLNYNDAFYMLFSKCFRNYLENMYSLTISSIDEAIYKVVSLALLNDGNKVIDDLTTMIYDELINENFELSFKRKRNDISYSDLLELDKKNNVRNQFLKDKILSYEISDDLSFKQLETIYACFSCNVFNSLDKKAKIHLMNLLYNYHTYDELYDFRKLYNDNLTNKDALSLVLNKLMNPGKTMIIIRKNMDMVNDVLSGKKIIYKNEIEKKNLNSLEDLKELINKNIR